MVTGKTLASGGSHGRESATGQGVVHCIIEWARDAASISNGATFTVQGFGNVGSNAAQDPGPHGRVDDRRRRLEGLHRQRRRHQPVQARRARADDRLASSAIRGARAITREEFFATPADVFIPAALELEIGVAEAKALGAS